MPPPPIAPPFRAKVLSPKRKAEQRAPAQGFDPDFEVDGLCSAWSAPAKERSAIAWERIPLPHFRQIRGYVEHSDRTNFDRVTSAEPVRSKMEGYSPRMCLESLQPKLPREFCLHSFRRTIGTRLGESGVEAFQIMRLLGHPSVTVSQRSVPPSSDSLETAFERWMDRRVVPFSATLNAEQAVHAHQNCLYVYDLGP
jgi:hypothetical protein